MSALNDHLTNQTFVVPSPNGHLTSNVFAQKNLRYENKDFIDINIAQTNYLKTNPGSRTRKFASQPRGGGRPPAL